MVICLLKILIQTLKTQNLQERISPEYLRYNSEIFVPSSEGSIQGQSKNPGEYCTMYIERWRALTADVVNK